MKQRTDGLVRLLVLLVGLAVFVNADAQAADEVIDFAREIRPLLSDTCFQCHGPDSAQRQAELRLDNREGMTQPRDGGRLVVPGDPANSLLYRRITADDPSERMPPEDSGRQLTDNQRDRIRRWIEQGGKLQDHWSFVPPERPAVPSLSAAGWERNAIDAFVLQRMLGAGFRPSPEASRSVLIRRLFLDLLGVPPTPEEVQEFVQDQRPNAYAILVDRILSSPLYGERLAVQWLDAARYADTSGYQNDGPRSMWRWRDWVIESLNANQSFAEFTVHQLAGDLLDNPTFDQLLATGFNRNHRGNAEGGIIPEEYAVEYVVDRVDTTATVWLGLTMGCARCHDHKFDPISQREFYQVYSFFNNVPESGRAIKEGNSPPFMPAPTRDQARHLNGLLHSLNAARRTWRESRDTRDAAQSEWEEVARGGDKIGDWTVTDGLIAWLKLDGHFENAVPTPAKEKSEEQADDAPDMTPGFRDGGPAFVNGRIGGAAHFDGKRQLVAGNLAPFGYFDEFTWAAWVRAESDHGTILSRMIDEHRESGYSLVLEDGRLQVNLVKRWLDDSLRVETDGRLPQGEWHHVAVTYDGTRVAKSIAVYVDGKKLDMHANLDGINQTFSVEQPLRIGAGGGPEGRFHGAIDDVRIYDRWLTSQEVRWISVADSIDELLAIPLENRTAAQAAKLRTYFVTHAAPEQTARNFDRLWDLRRRRRAFVSNLPTVMVMEEMRPPRPAFVLDRGQYDKPKEQVDPGVPLAISPFPEGASRNRLGFAEWLLAPSNPLTARVAVNRYWQMLFGQGIVRTAEDFGAQGAPPTHPLLLDWLATEFRRTDWDVKRMLRLIVTSATYRQSSFVPEAAHERDPENVFLSHGPRFRLSAPAVRDQVLAISGLLTRELGGPSVKPYQPAGLWQEIATDTDYQQSKGRSLYRRSLYTYWKRTVGPPEMMNFDASTREACTVRQTRTNTPLQALTLLNDITFVEASRVLAQNACKESPTVEGRLSYAFLRATARHPSANELAILVDDWREQREQFESLPRAATALLAVGEYPVDDAIAAVDLAAYTMTSSLILNLDEVVTRE